MFDHKVTGEMCRKDLEALGRRLGMKDAITGINRRLAYELTRCVRKRVGSNDLTVRIPWDDDEPPRTGEVWEVANIMSCVEDYRIPLLVAGSVMFRIHDRKIEVGRISVADHEAIAPKPSARLT